MNAQYTYEQIAADLILWAEFVDPDATMTECEFNELSIEEKVRLQIDAFGPQAESDLDGHQAEMQYTDAWQSSAERLQMLEADLTNYKARIAAGYAADIAASDAEWVRMFPQTESEWLETMTSFIETLSRSIDKATGGIRTYD